MPIDSNKISTALAKIRGKTIDRIFLVDRGIDGYQLFSVFMDASHYEFYGSGYFNGARVIDRGGVAELRASLARTAGVVEIGASDDASERS